MGRDSVVLPPWVQRDTSPNPGREFPESTVMAAETAGKLITPVRKGEQRQSSAKPAIFRGGRSSPAQILETESRPDEVGPQSAIQNSGRSRGRRWFDKAGALMKSTANKKANSSDWPTGKVIGFPMVPGEEMRNHELDRTSTRLRFPLATGKEERDQEPNPTSVRLRSPSSETFEDDFSQELGSAADISANVRAMRSFGSLSLSSFIHDYDTEHGFDGTEETNSTIRDPLRERLSPYSRARIRRRDTLEVPTVTYHHQQSWSRLAATSTQDSPMPNDSNVDQDNRPSNLFDALELPNNTTQSSLETREILCAESVSGYDDSIELATATKPVHVPFDNDLNRSISTALKHGMLGGYQPDLEAEGDQMESRYVPNRKDDPANHQDVSHDRSEAMEISKGKAWTNSSSKKDSFPILWEDDSDRASLRSTADSIWSVASIVSTVTNFSATSGYSAVQIQTATKELLRLLIEDDLLVRLCISAIRQPYIGPVRLRRNIRRLLVAFAQDLKEEAWVDLEKLAARLVALQASYVARAIVDTFDIKHTEGPYGAKREESSDEEQEGDIGTIEEPVDEHLIEDLPAFRAFLVNGNAFSTFRLKLESFVLPKQMAKDTVVSTEASKLHELPKDEARELPLSSEESLEESGSLSPTTKGIDMLRDPQISSHDQTLLNEIDQLVTSTEPYTMSKNIVDVVQLAESSLTTPEVNAMAKEPSTIAWKLRNWYSLLVSNTKNFTQQQLDQMSIASRNGYIELGMVQLRWLINQLGGIYLPVALASQCKEMRSKFERYIIGLRAARADSASPRQAFIKNVLIRAGYLEPPLDPEFVRLRWRCKCGGNFFGDVKEYHSGGVNTLVEKMSRSTGSRVTLTRYNETSAIQNWSLKAPGWMGWFNGVLTSTSRAAASEPPSGLPLHSTSHQSTPSSSSISANATPVSHAPGIQPSIHLLACAHRTQRRKCLLQDPINTICTDRALFTFMGQQLKRNRSRIRSILSMRSVQGMYFVKFRLRRGNMVEVRDHNPCCTSTSPKTCECIPPAAKVEPSPNAEYRCTPAGPLATWPPVLSQDLMHMLLSPQCINEQETWVLEQLPKRTKGELLEPTGPPAEGWGVYYQEGVDFDMIIVVIFVVFLLASLLFAILWTRYEMDIQGAFGVSSYMITAVGIALAMVASRAKNFG